MALAKAPTSHSRRKSGWRSSSRTAGRSFRRCVSGEFIGPHAIVADIAAANEESPEEVDEAPSSDAGQPCRPRHRLRRRAAQAAWPAKTVRFIVPFAPGGGTDTVSRLICDQLGRTFGQQFVVDNKGGAGGNIGTRRARARGARRLHDRADHGGEPHAQPDALHQAALRSRQGHRRRSRGSRCCRTCSACRSRCRPATSPS